MMNTKEIATETLKIIEEGFYQHKEIKIDVAKEIQNSINKTFTISPGNWNQILSNVNTKDVTTEIVFKNCTTIESIVQENNDYTKAVLNFASAKNPGGGFIGGASAQEESLARSSSLYASLMKDNSMYEFNRGNKTFLYSDYVIYSPEVVFWFDDNGNSFSKPIIIDVITSPAPNKGAMLQHNRIQELEMLEDVFRKRINKILGLALYQNVECLILGAWGCGVFRNEAEEVARLFKEVINQNYSNRFKKIVFAIYDQTANKNNFNKFKNAFEI